MIPDDPQLALQVRATDRFYDLHLHDPMQKLVADELRPADGHDPIGVGEARERLQTALRIADSQMANRRWAAGDLFSMADCAAAPPLFFINKMLPLADGFACDQARCQRCDIDCLGHLSSLLQQLNTAVEDTHPRVRSASRNMG